MGISEQVWQRRWLLVVAGGVIMGMALGIRHVQGLFMQPVILDREWSREAFGFALAIQNLAWGIFQPFTGMLADRYGSAKVLFGGALAYVLGLVLMAQSVTPLQFTLTNGLLIGIALSGTAFGAVYGALSRLFPAEHRSWALGVAGAIGGLGQFCMVPLAQGLLDRMDWTMAAIVLGILMLLIAPLAAFLRERPVPQAAQEARQTMGQAIREAFSHRGFWLLNLGFLACGFQLAFIATHMPSYLMEKGLSAQQAGATLAIIALSNILGTYLCGYLGGFLRRKYLLSWIYLLRAVAIALFITVPLSPLSAYTFAFVMGLLWLGTVPLTNGLVSQVFGVRYITTLFGFVFFGHQVGSFFGVWLGGYVYDQTRSYDLLWLGSIGVGLMAAMLHWPINDRQIVRPALAGGQTA
ncbi:Oxalate/formate antiporter [plant metagenome]|uniref:Oxalate/formate antiporter n=1 Tax=plant metagenome TaxID=1297885 RepID=A0A484TEB0_9ZZZZ